MLALIRPALLIAALVFSVVATLYEAPGASAQQQTRYNVVTIERKPFAMPAENGWTGFSIDLWNAVAEEIAVQSNFAATDTFNDLLERVEFREADVAVANISITHGREQRMDFSQPIFDAGLMVMMPVAGEAKIFDVIFDSSVLLWVMGAVALLFLAANLVWLLERRDVDEFRTGYLRGVSNGLWWAVNVVTNAGFDIVSPATRAGRLLAFGLIIIGLFVVSAFVAQITAALTVNQLTNQVNGYEDLYTRKVGTTSGSTSAAFLTENSVQHATYDTIEEMFAALEDGKVEAVVHDAPILAHYAQTDGKGRFATVGRVFNPEKYGFAMQSGNPRTEEINRALLKLRENGTYAALVEKWFGADYQ